jgi:hypothetical protein
MRLKFVSGTVLVAALAAVLLLPGSALPVADVHEHDHGLADYDSRTGKVAPTNLQRSLAAKMQAKVSWGQFGTPASITRYGKFLSRNVRGKTAAAAARLWLKRNYRVFGLRSLDGVALESANRLASSHVDAVNFRQVFKGLPGATAASSRLGSAARRTPARGTWAMCRRH